MPESLLMILWEPDTGNITGSINSRFPQVHTHYFCLQTASQQLLQESHGAASGVRPAKYIFNQLMSTSREYDEETTASKNLLLDWLTNATVLVTLSNLPHTRQSVPNLKLIHLLSAGIDQVIENPLIKSTEIDVTTSSGIHGIPLAEWVLMTVLGFRKSFLSAHEFQQQHSWPTDKSMFSGADDLFGKRVGILGYGSIGRQADEARVAVGRLLSAFGCSILAYTASPCLDADSRRDRGFVIPGTGDPSGTIPSEWFSGVDKSSLRMFLSQGFDILVLTLPLTPSTVHLLSTEEFQIIADHANRAGGKCFLVNVARGRVIDQPALEKALNDNLLAGAALDVATPEPLPPDASLWTAKNIIITPHISTLGSNYQPRAFDILMANLEKRSKGEKMFNLVDRNKGY